ncbi:MAG: thiamine ABC transporter substrate-binding protein [Treponema sp.]|jgi:thiamine transport system substrate-binding protein|nr:thiamine ABC transporter substrate-binding protein [Treponema sp.]
MFSLLRKKSSFGFVMLLTIYLLAAPESFARASQQHAATPVSEIVVWTYDSFTSEWGPGPEISGRFEEASGIHVRWVVHGDAGEVLARLLLEGVDADADVVLGLDQNMAARALRSGLLEAYKPVGADKLFPESIFDASYRMIPFDYSYFAVIYDSERIVQPPTSLEALCAPEYERSLILMDPRTSSPGLGFLAWTKAAYGSGWKDYWGRLAPSILTIADGWSSGYGLFTAGEAPLVLSYTTSPGYHVEYEDTERFKAALFDAGHPIQVETASLVAAGKHKENAKKFLDFMLTPAFQETIPLGNWMYPVIDIPLPDSFRVNPKSDTPLWPEAPSDAELSEWAVFMAERLER